MITREVNAFDLLRQDLEAAVSRKIIDPAVEEKMQPIVQLVFRTIKQTAPRSTSHPAVKKGIDHWGKSLQDSIVKPVFVDTEDHKPGKQAVINLDHPTVRSGGFGNTVGRDILDWVMFGTNPHYVPKAVSDRRISFYWRNARDGGPDGWRTSIRHRWGRSTFERGYWAKGMEGDKDFVQKVADRHDSHFEKARDQVMDEINVNIGRSPYLDREF